MTAKVFILYGCTKFYNLGQTLQLAKTLVGYKVNLLRIHVMENANVDCDSPIFHASSLISCLCFS